MNVLVDSGVLLRAFDKLSSDRRSILRAFRILRGQGHILITSHQNVAEFWNVATRPASARGGFGLSPAEAGSRLATVERLAKLLPFNHNCYGIWRQLLMQHGIIGVSVHDARLVATMNAFAVSHILTLNASDF